MTAPHSSRFRHPRSWSLRTQLVTSILLLFIAVTLASGAATVWWSRNSLMTQVDSQLEDAAQGAVRGPVPVDGLPGQRQARSQRPPGLGGGMLVLVTTPQGGIPDQDENYVTDATGTSTTLTAAQVRVLNRVVPDKNPRSVDLGGTLGSYRVIAVERDDGLVAVRGLPLEPIDDNVRNLAAIVAILSGLGLLAIGGATAFVVRRSLLPLHRVASTATRVSHVPLSQGAVGTTERVPLADTDTRTEVGQVGAALNGLLDHVDQSLAARHQSEMQVRQFVADASHELRTPLSSIKGYAELSRRETEPVPPTVTHALGRIESESNRMATLVEDLLLLARLDAGRPLDQEPVDLTRLVVESVSDAHAAGPDHQWSLDLPEEPTEVVGDEARLRQVLINLLANARRHTPDGTEVRTAIRPQRDHVDVTVTDNGPGIPADHLPHIFERFARGDSARTRVEGSTGLGLSIVHAVIAAHHGTVHVTSGPGHTEFILRLPRSLDFARAAAATSHRGEG